MNTVIELSHNFISAIKEISQQIGNKENKVDADFITKRRESLTIINDNINVTKNSVLIQVKVI